jgi:DNA-binding response OmpR family regulator
MTKKTEILVVEDDEALSSLTCRVLEAYGFTAKPALEGGTGLEQARQEPPDVMLLDLMLPDMTGFEVCEKIKQNPQTAEIPIIMVTAVTDELSRLRGMAAGAFAYLTKPYDPEFLIQTIRQAAMQCCPAGVSN